MRQGREIVACVLIAIITAVPFVGANEWKSFEVKSKGRSNTVSIPVYKGGKKLPIRGVMQGCNGPLKEFAHKNQVAMFKRMDDGRGFSKELLKAAAKATGRPELEFAGAIVEGISKHGRNASKWAAANQARAIAVILDHSDCVWGQPPMVKGVPMFFNSTYANMFQKIDRRMKHYNWCNMGFRMGQPCTSVIDINKKGGHHGRGQTAMTAVWLEEAMAHRVPKSIPIGKPYKLIDVDPKKCGGYVSLKLDKDGARTFHDNVSVLAQLPQSKAAPKRSIRSRRRPTTTSGVGVNWWIPGPKTAALYLKWVKENGGKIVKDETAKIKAPANLLAKK